MCRLVDHYCKTCRTWVWGPEYAEPCANFAKCMSIPSRKYDSRCPAHTKKVQPTPPPPPPPPKPVDDKNKGKEKEKAKK